MSGEALDARQADQLRRSSSSQLAQTLASGATMARRHHAWLAMSQLEKRIDGLDQDMSDLGRDGRHADYRRALEEQTRREAAEAQAAADVRAAEARAELQAQEAQARHEAQAAAFRRQMEEAATCECRTPRLPLGRPLRCAHSPTPLLLPTTPFAGSTVPCCGRRPLSSPPA